MGLVRADFKDRTYRRRVDRRPRRRRLLLKLLGQPLANRDRRRAAICLKARLAHTRAIHLDLQPQRRAHRRAARFGSEYRRARGETRSEEHTSELQSLMRISYAVFRLNKKKTQK